MSGKDATNLIGLSKDALIEVMAGMGEKPFRARQLWHWIYERGETDFAAMTPLGKSLRQTLGGGYSIARPEISRHLTSQDGARKWLLRFDDGNEAETVYIPEDDRGALCLSTQVGCTMTCAFCRTGTQLLVRDLSAAEIVAQVMVARDACDEWPSQKAGRMISNIVVMGMGEPLHNEEPLYAALDVLSDRSCFGLSPSRVLVSTVGIPGAMVRCARRYPAVRIALSLHSVRQEVRERIMPIARRYGLAELRAAMAEVAAIQRQEVMIEYLMLAELNDKPQHARELAQLLAGREALINVIPYNPVAGLPYQTPNMQRQTTFRRILEDAGLQVRFRHLKGDRIDAACGQLRRSQLHLPIVET